MPLLLRRRLRGNLTTHIDTVHLKLRDHACSYCPGVAFGKKGSLTKHINHVHLKLSRCRLHAEEKKKKEARVT